MMRKVITSCCLAIVVSGCVTTKEPTIASLDHKEFQLEKKAIPKITRSEVMDKYREFIDYATGEPMYGNAVRRLADIELESAEADNETSDPKRAEIGRRKMEAAIRMYLTYIETYPHRENLDLILYQLAKAYDLVGDQIGTLTVLNKLVDEHPHSRHFTESQFRRGEMLFVLKDFANSEKAYQQITAQATNSVFYEKSLYKMGWARFKQNHYTNGLHAFFQLLDHKKEQQLLTPTGPADKLSRAEADIQNDTLRGVSLAFTYLKGAKGIKKYFAKHGHRDYEPVVYQRLAGLYQSKERFKDAADTYLAFGQHYPNSELAPFMHQDAIEVYKKANLPGQQLATKESFVKRYATDGQYWQKQPKIHNKLKPLLQAHLSELAQHYHAVARKQKQAKKKQLAYRKSIGWYKAYIRSFPSAKKASQLNMLLAEAYDETRQYASAIREYEKTAYDYPKHRNSAEAGYAALLTYNKLLKLKVNSKKKKQTKKQVVTLAKLKRDNTRSALRFGLRFPKDKRLPGILTNTSQQLYAMGDYPLAIETAQRVIDSKQKSKKLRTVAYTVMGHAKFDQADYPGAEQAYLKLLKGQRKSRGRVESKRLITKNRKAKKQKRNRAIEDRLAAAIYKQGEQSRKQGNLELAAHHFLRLPRVTPGSKLRINAEYDGATVLFEKKDYKKAEKVLVKFRRRYPKQKKLQQGVTEKLALIYTNTKQNLKAAAEMENLARLPNKSKSYKRERLWEAAELYQDAGKLKKSSLVYKQYVKKFPRQYPESIEARYQLATYYKKKRQSKKQVYWLKETVKAQKKAGKANTERTRFLAADASLTMAYPLMTSYRKASLNIPLKRSLKQKKRLMERTIQAYKEAMTYKVADVTTSATYHIAEVYHDFSRALISSQRPRGLSAEEKEQYDILLEEQAFPFEEKAIDIHAANMKFVQKGIYDKWIRNSLKQLQSLQPVRYGKTEKGEPYVSAMH